MHMTAMEVALGLAREALMTMPGMTTSLFRSVEAMLLIALAVSSLRRVTWTRGMDSKLALLVPTMTDNPRASLAATSKRESISLGEFFKRCRSESSNRPRCARSTSNLFSPRR
jgi:hypothetical protein